jgi:hypothetical protein
MASEASSGAVRIAASGTTRLVCRDTYTNLQRPNAVPIAGCV